MLSRIDHASDRTAPSARRQLRPEGIRFVTGSHMHASSLENMYRCHERYIRGSGLLSRGEVLVVDIGGSDINGSYREVFADPRFRYVSVDADPAAKVDVVLEDPYRLPFETGSVDVVLSGQMLEHAEFFWLTFAEMVRVLKPDGYLFLIAPSAGPIHRYPVDCYRFYPDAFHALAKFANCHVIDLWMDERGPWRDLVGVFAKHAQAPSPNAAGTGSETNPPFDPRTLPKGTPEEESTRGETHYREVLARIHASLAPSLYLEIGVRFGLSLRLARCTAVGIDPAPAIEGELPSSTRIIRTTSDEYFAGMSGHPLPHAPDFAFIDGMHAFEFALRDFMNLERIASPATLIAIDDIYPCHPAQAERVRRTHVWTGDVWRLHRALKETRPDLILLPLDTGPTGLLLVAGLDPANRVFWDEYNPLVRRFREMPGPPDEVLERRGAIAPSHPVVEKAAALLGELRHAARERVDASLRSLLRGEGLSP